MNVLIVALVCVLMACFTQDVQSDIAGINVRQMLYYTSIDLETMKTIAQRRACMMSYCPMPYCGSDDGWDLRGSDWGCCGNYPGCCERASPLCYWHDMVCTCCENVLFCGLFCVKDAHCYYDSDWNQEPLEDEDGTQFNVTDVGKATEFHVTQYTESHVVETMDNETVANDTDATYFRSPSIPFVITNSNTIIGNTSGPIDASSTANMISTEGGHKRMPTDNITDNLSRLSAPNVTFTSSAYMDDNYNLQLEDYVTCDNCSLSDVGDDFTGNHTYIETYDVTNNAHNATYTGPDDDDDDDGTSLSGLIFSSNEHPINSDDTTTPRISDDTTVIPDREISSLRQNMTQYFGSHDFNLQSNITVSNETETGTQSEYGNDIIGLDVVKHHLSTTNPFVPNQEDADFIPLGDFRSRSNLSMVDQRSRPNSVSNIDIDSDNKQDGDNVLDASVKGKHGVTSDAENGNVSTNTSISNTDLEKKRKIENYKTPKPK